MLEVSILLVTLAALRSVLLRCLASASCDRKAEIVPSLSLCQYTCFCYPSVQYCRVLLPLHSKLGCNIQHCAAVIEAAQQLPAIASGIVIYLASMLCAAFLASQTRISQSRYRRMGI